MPRRLSEWLHRRSKNRLDVDLAASSATNITPDSSKTATLQKKAFPSGIKLLYNPEHSVVDIILVHGLTGDYEKTWTAKNVATPWPQSILPSKIPNARILTFGYDAYIADWRGMVSRNRIGNHSMNLLTSVATFRENDDTNNCPIIFICHSLGGLVCEDALTAAARRPERHLRNIIDCTRGVIFLGTPHHGSGLAKWAGMLTVMIGVLKQTNADILAVLERDSEVLARVQDEFHTMVRSRNQEGLQSIEITCFYEELPLPGIGIVVPKNSAILPGYIPIGIHGNHMDMTKFDNEDEPGFIAIAGELRRWIKELTVQNRQQYDTNTTKHGNRHWMVPRPVNKLFTGRTELVLQVQAALRCDYTSSTTRQRRFVITGMGGLGKSEVCLKVADLVREEFWAVFWVNVDKPTTAENDFIAIAKLLGRSAESIAEALQVLASIKKNWLLILDNADDPKFDYQNYFPSGTHGSVIMTSRVTECKRYSPDAFKALESLGEQESKELLLKVAGLPREEWSSFESQAIEVVCLLGSHTLALIQAGAYIARGHCQLSEYPGVFKRQRNRLLTYRPQQAQSRYCDVYATFEASADILKQSQTEAAQDALYLLDTLSTLASSVLPLQIFKEAWNGSRNVISINSDEISSMDGLFREHISRLPAFVVADGDEWDPFRLLEACALLVSLSLVTRHDLQADGLYGLSMHPLTHAWARDRQTSNQKSIAWLATGCVIAFSKSSESVWQTQEKLLIPHIQSYLDIMVQRVLLFGPTAVVMPILIKCGWILQDMRLDSRLKQLLDGMFEELGKDPLAAQENTLALYDLQAGSLLDLGKSKQAAIVLEQVVKIREITQAEDHPSRLASQQALAIAYEANGQVKEAVTLLEHVVKIRDITRAEDHPSRLASQHALAFVYKANGQVKEAVTLLEHVAKIQDITLAENHPDRLASQHALASAYKANGQVKEAIAQLEHVVKIQDIMLAENHPDRLASQHALAITYEANRQVKKAVALLEHVVKIKETTLAEDHPSRLTSQHALASVYEANGQVEEAVTLLEHVVKIRDITLAEDHPDRLASQHALAITYEANGQVKKAVTLLEHVVKIKETTLAEDHPDRLVSQHALAFAYKANGQVKEAVALLEHVVKIKETTLAEDHPSRIVSEQLLVYCLRQSSFR